MASVVHDRAVDQPEVPKSLTARTRSAYGVAKLSEFHVCVVVVPEAVALPPSRLTSYKVIGSPLFPGGVQVMEIES